MSWNTSKIILVPIYLSVIPLLFLPKKTLAFFTKNTYITNNVISSGYWESFDFSTPIEAANSIRTLWLSGKFNTLYDNLAEDLAGIYTKEEFMKSLQDTHIKEFEIEGNAIYRNNTQAYVVTKIKYLDNKTQEYKTIFNYEQGSWKLLGTVLAD